MQAIETKWQYLYIDILIETGYTIVVVTWAKVTLTDFEFI